MNNYKKILAVVGIAVVMGTAGFLFFSQKNNDVSAGVSDNTSGWAYSENIGWISFNCVNPLAGGCVVDYGVHVCMNDADPKCGAVSVPKAGVIIGRAWARGAVGDGGVGWISFNQADLGGCPQAPCRAWIDGVNNLRGWARAMTPVWLPAQAGGWDGWISLNCADSPDGCLISNYKVLYDNTTLPGSPRLVGWAWAGGGAQKENAVIGWLSVSAANELPTPPAGSVCDLAYCQANWGATTNASCKNNLSCGPGSEVLGSRPASSCASGELCVCCGPIGAPPPAGTNCNLAYCQANWPGTQTAVCNNTLTCGAGQVYLGHRAASSCLVNEDCVCCGWGVVPPIIVPPNLKPDPPSNLNVQQLQCAWGSSPTVNNGGLAIIFSWDYSDPENTAIPGSDPQTAYEIWVDNNAAFADPKFAHIENSNSTSYTLDLSEDDVPPAGDWLVNLNWNATYHWKARVRDTAGNWSDWSVQQPFTTPMHASPLVDFEWLPQNPTTGEVIQLCSGNSLLECPAGVITNISKCYNNAFAEVPCASHLWDITGGLNGSYLDITDQFTQNPRVGYTSRGIKSVKLQVTDPDGNSCDIIKQINVKMPLPGWKEISP